MEYKLIQEEQFKLYPSRFMVVGLYSLVQMMTSILLGTLNPIAAYLSTIYQINSVVVNLGGLLFTLMHPLFTFPAAYVIDTYGSRKGIMLGSCLCLIGSGLRMLCNYGFYWVIMGMILCGIGRPFILNCQAKISANWFSAEKRGGVTQLLTLVLNVSLIIGVLIPGLIFSGYDNTEQNREQGKKITFKLMLLQAAMGLVCFGLNIIFQKDKPPTPPSQSGVMNRQPFAIAIPKMLKNRNYLLLLTAFGCYFGIFNAVSLLLSYIIKPWFGNGKDSNLPLAVIFVGCSPVISGILGVIILGPIQRRSGKFKKWIIICMCGSSLAIILFYPMLLANNLILASLISAFNSFWLIPLVPIMLELSCQLVFPVGEGSAVGLLFAMGNLSGFIFGLIMSVIIRGQTKMQTLAGLGFCFLMFIIGFILVIFMKEQKNREKAEQQSAYQKKSSVFSGYTDQQKLQNVEKTLEKTHDKSYQPADNQSLNNQ